jgi:hypothetical protein
MIGLLSLSLAGAPVCWSHYQVLQYPGVALMLVSAVRLRAWRIAAAVAVCFAFAYQLPEVALRAYHDKYAGWSAASPATLYFWSSVAPLACVGLFGLALRNVKHCAPKSDRKPYLRLAIVRQELQNVRVGHVRTRSRPQFLSRKAPLPRGRGSANPRPLE